MDYSKTFNLCQDFFDYFGHLCQIFQKIIQKICTLFYSNLILRNFISDYTEDIIPFLQIYFHVFQLPATHSQEATLKWFCCAERKTSKGAPGLQNPQAPLPLLCFYFTMTL